MADCENRLIDVNEDGNSVASYVYDHLARRIAKTVDGNTTKYCYDGRQVIAEYDGSDTLLRKFVYGPGIDEPICMIDVADSNKVYYYHFDGLGSVVAQGIAAYKVSNMVSDMHQKNKDTFEDIRTEIEEMPEDNPDGGAEDRTAAEDITDFKLFY